MLLLPALFNWNRKTVASSTAADKQPCAYPVPAAHMCRQQHSPHPPTALCLVGTEAVLFVILLVFVKEGAAQWLSEALSPVLSADVDEQEPQCVEWVLLCYSRLCCSFLKATVCVWEG